MKKICSYALLVLTFAACAKDNSSNPSPGIGRDVQAAAADPDIQNKNFVSDCALKPVDAILTGVLTGLSASVKSAHTFYRFEGASITRTTQLYPSTDCSGDAAINLQERGEFTLHTDQKTADGGKYIDINFHNLFVTTATDVGVKAANAVQFCNAADWTVNLQREETAQAAAVNCLSAPMPRTNANIYRLDGNVLYLGAQPTAQTAPGSRPANLDLNTKYTVR